MIVPKETIINVTERKKGNDNDVPFWPQCCYKLVKWLFYVNISLKEVKASFKVLYSSNFNGHSNF